MDSRTRYALLSLVPTLAAGLVAALIFDSMAAFGPTCHFVATTAPLVQLLGIGAVFAVFVGMARGPLFRAGRRLMQQMCRLTRLAGHLYRPPATTGHRAQLAARHSAARSRAYGSRQVTPSLVVQAVSIGVVVCVLFAAAVTVVAIKLGHTSDPLRICSFGLITSFGLLLVGHWTAHLLRDLDTMAPVAPTVPARPPVYKPSSHTGITVPPEAVYVSTGAVLVDAPSNPLFAA